MPVLQFRRVIPRDFRGDDSKDLFELYRLPETSRYESWSPHETIDEPRALLEYRIARQSDVPRTNCTFAIDLDGTFIGLCGLELGFGPETDDLRTAESG